MFRKYFMKKTRLHSQHIAQGARMIPFSGWEMPVFYSSIVKEHLAVRNQAGLFDVSHMGNIAVRGKQALSLLQYLTCNDLRLLQNGKVQYNLLLNSKGGVVDDLIIYQNTTEDFFIIVNAVNHEKVLAYLMDFCQRLSSKAQILDESENWGQLALQGPQAQAILNAVIPQNWDALAYFHFRDLKYEGQTLRISRTGYTGEDGFELYAQPLIITQLWNRLLQYGKPLGLLPIGLGARDSLRLEAFYPLYGQELRDDWTPIESSLGWMVKKKDATYLGYDGIMEHKNKGSPGKVVGFELKAAKLARSGCSVYDHKGEKQISQVLSAAYSPVRESCIGSLYLPSQYDNFMPEVQIQIRNEPVLAHIQQTPFVDRRAGKPRA